MVTQLCHQLLAAVCEPQEESHRRAEAAYQYAVLCIGRLQISQESAHSVDKCLTMLSLSADLGHIGSQSIVGCCHAAFHKAPDFDQNKEKFKWLRRGVKAGNLSAKQRLKNLDLNLYFDALKSLRTRYAGIGTKIPWEYKYFGEEDLKIILEHSLATHEHGHPDRTNLFILFTICGRLQELQRLLPEVDVNASNTWNETPLLVACRSGNADIVRFLLDSGADPSFASDEGVTSLHFLAAFDQSEVEDIAQRLCEKKAPLEARAIHGNLYGLVVNSTFGQGNGTPLLWAVAADSRPATKALMDLGADPFDLAAKDALTDDSWGRIIHVSPLFYAATNHQYYLLESLLPSENGFFARDLRRLMNTDVKHKLNHNARAMGTHGLIDVLSPLGYCATYSAQGLLKRHLLHGDEHEVAFMRTFETLVRAGTDPLDVDGKGTSVLVIAVENGQPFAIHFLMGWSNNSLRPSPRLWLELLVETVSFSDHIVYETLRQYSMADDLDTADWKKFFGSMARMTNDVQFLQPFREYRDPNDDYADHFSCALRWGNFDVAKWFFTTGKCNVLVQQDGFSILGRLVNHSKTFASSVRAIESMLCLDDLPNEVFYNYLDLQGSQLSALHAAALHFEYWKGKQPAHWVIHKVVERWNERVHLNLQVAEGDLKGFTALHIAVKDANVPGGSLPA